MIDLTAVLCYVDPPWAYFTTLPLSEQWGDDWDDAPYEHNASPPHGPEVVRVAYYSCHSTPAALCRSNSRYSVQQINSGAVAWLAAEFEKDVQPILAGTTLQDFVKIIHASEGVVYFPHVPDALPRPPRNPPGVLEVGVNEHHEVVINLPREMTGHIVFSHDQAFRLARTLLDVALEAAIGGA